MPITDDVSIFKWSSCFIYSLLVCLFAIDRAEERSSEKRRKNKMYYIFQFDIDSIMNSTLSIRSARIAYSLTFLRKKNCIR